MINILINGTTQNIFETACKSNIAQAFTITICEHPSMQIANGELL